MDPRARPRSHPLSALGLLSAAAGFFACGTEESGPPPRWVADRVVPVALRDRQPRFSADNVNRMIWPQTDDHPVRLTGDPGAALEFELCRAPGAEPVSGSPGSVRVVVEQGNAEHPAAARNLAPRSLIDGGDPTPNHWSSWRADLSGVPAGAATLRIEVNGKHPGPGSGWVVSNPRLYQQRDNGGDPHLRQRLNVLIITIDTLRADLLGCYGYDRPTSPRIDGLAAEGILFDRAISQASWTLPSYASMFSGQYSEAHGVVHRDHVFDAPHVSFVECFAAAGYATGAVVSGTFTDDLWGFAQGFDHYDDLGMIQDDHAPPEGTDAAPDLTQPGAMAGAEKRITSPEVTDRAIAWLERHRDRRFLFAAHYFDPHNDFMSHEGISERFPPRPVPQYMKISNLPREAGLEEKLALHEGEIAFTDLHLGRLLDYLDESGLAEETVVVLCADHGEEFHERAKQGHGHGLFNELARVPLLLRIPGGEFPSGERVASPVANVDLGPTLLELCGVGEELPTTGESLVPLLRDPTASRAGPVYSSRFPTSGPPGDRGPQDWHRIDQGNDTLILVYQGRRQPQAFLFAGDDYEQRENLEPQRRAVGQALNRAYAEARKRWLAMQPPVHRADITEAIAEALEDIGYKDEDAGAADGEDD